MRRSLDLFSANYENLIISGDFNTETNQECMKLQWDRKTVTSVLWTTLHHSRENNMPFINKLKNLTNTHMKRSHLRNKHLQNRCDSNKTAYNRQGNYCAALLRKLKDDYYTNLDEKDVVSNKQFWRTVKSLLSDKINSFEKVTLVEGGKNSNAVRNLKIIRFRTANALLDHISYPTLKAI